MYIDWCGREIEDLEMDNMHRDWLEDQRERKRMVWKRLKKSREGFQRRVLMDGFKKRKRSMKKDNRSI